MKTSRFGALVAMSALVVLVGLGLNAQTTGPTTANFNRKAASLQAKLFSTNSTASAFTYSAGGRANIGTSVTTIKLNAGYRGVRIVPFGEGNDNTTYDYRVWLVHRAAGTTSGTCEIAYYGGGTCTLSTAVGSSTDLVTSSERFADTMTWTISGAATTPKGYAESSEAKNLLGESGVYSPADNTPAFLSIPDCDGALEVLIDVDMTGATSANFLVQLTP